jgi:hypothetical protein
VKKKLKRAIKLIEESRESHIAALIDPKAVSTGGNKFHRRCIKEYDYVLDVLNQAKEKSL